MDRGEPFPSGGDHDVMSSRRSTGARSRDRAVLLGLVISSQHEHVVDESNVYVVGERTYLRTER